MLCLAGIEGMEGGETKVAGAIFTGQHIAEIGVSASLEIMFTFCWILPTLGVESCSQVLVELLIDQEQSTHMPFSFTLRKSFCLPRWLERRKRIWPDLHLPQSPRTHMGSKTIRFYNNIITCCMSAGKGNELLFIGG